MAVKSDYQSWGDDYSAFVYPNESWFERSGGANYGSDAGLFTSHNGYGRANVYGGWRTAQHIKLTWYNGGMLTKKKLPPRKIPLVKRFRAWHKLKYKIHFNDNIPAGYKEREIWWVSLGNNVGVEEDGKGDMFNRPVLIIRGFSKYQFWGVPLSTTAKTGKYYYKFVVNGKVSTALLSQLRVLDTKRFINKYGMVNTRDFTALKRKLKEFLE
jgi:mRNA-degrading endonuclease toxin of MazEF toxin-antitoxin module